MGQGLDLGQVFGATEMVSNMYPRIAGQAFGAVEDRPTRADLIRKAQRIAAERGVGAPRLSFVRDGSQAWLHADCGSEVIRLDGSGQVINDRNDPDGLSALPR